MKKWILLIAFSALCAVAIPSLQIDHVIRKKVIYIKNGAPVLVDSINQKDPFVFYEADGEHGMFMKNDVTGIGSSVPIQTKTSILEILESRKRKFLEGRGGDGNFIKAADCRILLFFIFLGLSFVSMKLAFFVAGVVKTKLNAASRKEPSETAGKNAPVDQENQEDYGYRDIISFFMELFKVQNGLDASAPSRFSLRSSSPSSKRKVFELDVKGEHDWIGRRMSISPLGEDSGSKSKCYYVIYDTHMVVKIPPESITEVGKYITAIRKEVEIASQLAPVACIVPMVSVVLKKVKKLPYESSLTQAQLEKQYIRLVEEHPEFQNHLKIGDRFAFFMELTNNFFLSGVIDKLHKAENSVREELHASPELAWSQDAFTNRYGFENLPVFEGIQELYRLCEAEAVRLIKEAGKDNPVHQFQIKKWFLATITGDDALSNSEGMDANLIKRIHDAFLSILETKKTQVDSLVQMLKSKLATTSFRKNRPQIKNIASNMLVLLCQLKEKRIALRDLKPDNLFLDADPDTFPVFLGDQSAFAIGVIDVETAVSLDPRPDGTIAQPLIGGTPLYATPLHLLKNKALADNFGSLSDLLHFQDWHATMAIIFKAITGANLFPRAARTFPGALKILKTSSNPNAPDSATVQKMSQGFWSAAAMDMKKQLVAFSTVLDDIDVVVPDAMAESIKTELEREKASLKNAINKHIALSPLMKSKKNQTFLINATADDITRQIERWKDPTHLPEQHRQMAAQMVPFLNNLSKLKKGEKEKNEALAAFAMEPHEIKAKALMEAMFHIVFQVMYKKKWKTLSKTRVKETEAQLAVKEDSNLVATILSET